MSDNYRMSKRPYLESLGYKKKPKNNNKYVNDCLKRDKKEVEELIAIIKAEDFVNKNNKQKVLEYLNKQSLRIHHKKIIVNR